ncbi:RapZ C-terminal domain-containing protein [Streptomyces pseudovenezuelae]|uniref:RapZ C-terminal domain-containing protein n=1 Tax=Streptomyces pseudovenezuelae TaxID=67350 RepID=UPI0036E94769
MPNYSDSEFPWVHIETFGFDHGVPQTTIGCLLVDLRGVELDDPDDQPELAGRDGKDAEVIQHVMASPMTFTRIEEVVGQAQALLDFNARKNFTLRVLIGDDTGRTRAVVLGNAVAEILNARGILTEVEHRHLGTGAPR